LYEIAGGGTQPIANGRIARWALEAGAAKKIWSTEDDDQGHDNMDHMAMPMKMH
jgi:hypothetical protein